MVEEKVFGEYGRKKLLMYADSFLDLANSFAETEQAEAGNMPSEGREKMLKEHSFRESMQVLKDNLSEVSQILQKVAEETAVCIELPERQKKKVIRMLGKEKILVKDIYYIEENGTGKVTLNVTMCTDKTSGCMAREVADMLSVIMDKRLNLSGQSPYLVDHEERTFFFLEDPPFMVLTGYARAVREQEKISGDNYSIMELDCGKLVILLSDGMGSGEKACQESRSVIERMETLLEAGHTINSAVNIVNNTLLAAGEPANMSTLDVCSLDLYTGKCEFRKMGAAASFIKSSVYVEPIIMNRLPLGIFFRNEDEYVSRELMDNDYLIMVTDGVLDAFSAGDYEEMLGQYLRDMRECSPAEVAKRILQFALKCSGGHIKDDMTILVLEVFQSR
jgi:stage II sporulation protein E